MAISLLSNAQVSIGSGSGGSGTSSYPISPYYGYSYSQSIFLASELNSSGNITSLKYILNAGSNFDSADDELDVWIGHTSKNKFDSVSDWIDVSGLTQVFTSGTCIISSDTLTISLASNFAYNGVDNLVIAIDANESGFGGSSSYCISSVSGSNNMTLHRQSDSANPDPAGTLPSGTLTTSRGNIVFEGISVACLPPSDMAVQNVTTNSADLSWTIGGSSESDWNVEYHTSNFVPGTSVSGVVSLDVNTNATANLTGLSDATNYFVYYQADCSNGDESIWVGPFEFTTACNSISSFPWEEDFNSITTPNLPNCWTSINNNTDVDFFKSYSTYGVNGSKTAGLYTDYNGGLNDDYLILPRLTLTGNERLLFSVRSRTTGEPNDYRVVLSTTGKEVADFTAELQSLDTVNSATQTQIDPIDLSSYSGDVYIAIHVPAGGLDGYFIYFDDFVVEEIPSCLPPSSMEVSNVSTSQADLTWMASASSETDWNIEYNTTDFAPGSNAPGIVSVAVSGMPDVSLSSLTANTSYFVYYQSSCASGDTSVWVGPFEFLTSCESVSTFPWTEDFNSVSTPELPSCWSSLNNNSDGDFFKSYTSFGVSSSITAGLYTDYNGGSNDDYLILPKFTLTGNQRLSFSVRSRTTGEPNDYRVVLSTTGSSASDFNVELQALDTVNSTVQTPITPIDLSAYSGDVYIAIHVPAGGLDGYYIYFDDFLVEDLPSCLEPGNMSVASLTSSSADLLWTASGSLETDWNIEYSTSDFVPGTAAVNVISVASNGSPTETLSGLSDNSSYYVYYQSNCSASDQSTWIGPFEFQTPCASISSDLSVDFTLNVPNSCWNEASSGTPLAGPSGSSADWRSGRGYTRLDSSVVNSNALNLYDDDDQEWLLSQLVDPTTQDLTLTVEVAVTNYKFSGASLISDTDVMGSDDTVQLVVTRNSGVTWDVLTTWDVNNQPLTTGTTFEVDLSNETSVLQFGFWGTDGSVNDSEDYDFHVGMFSISTVQCQDTTVNNNYIGCNGNGYSETIGNSIYDETNPTGVDTLSTVLGCDSIIVTNLVFNPGVADTIVESSCDGEIVINGETYTTSGTFTQDFTASNGCDSTLVLELDIEENISLSVSQNGNDLLSSHTGDVVQWFNCVNDQPLQGETDSIYSPSVNGEYYVEVTVGNCTFQSDCFSTNGIGLDDLNSTSFSIYPNPSSGEINLSWDESVEYNEIEISNTIGQVVYSRLISSEDNSMLINLDYGSGLYFVKLLSDNNNTEIKSLVIK